MPYDVDKAEICVLSQAEMSDGKCAGAIASDRHMAIDLY